MLADELELLIMVLQDVIVAFLQFMVIILVLEQVDFEWRAADLVLILNGLRYPHGHQRVDGLHLDEIRDDNFLTFVIDRDHLLVSKGI